MDHASHLLLRGTTWQYRRRVPGMSSVIQIPLGTSDRTSAFRLSILLTAEFDMTLDRLLRSDRLIPDELVQKYFDFCLRKIVRDLTTQRRKMRMSGEITQTGRRTEEIRRIVTSHMITDGLSRILPMHRIAEFESPEDLEIAMTVHQQQFTFITGASVRPHYKAAASIILGTKDRHPDQTYQLTEAFLHAQAAALEVVDGSPAELARVAAIRSAELMSGTRTTVPTVSDGMVHQVEARPEPVVPIAKSPAPLTEGLSLITGRLTHELLDDQFAIARSSAEPLDRSPKTEPFSHDLAGACERSIKRAQMAKKMDDKTADSRRMTVKLFMFINNLQLITEVEQHHLAIFVKAISRLPKHFNRSKNDRQKTYSEVVAEARILPDDQLGRDPGTVNRHLDTMGAILHQARVQDKIPVDRDIDTTTLRLPEIKRARDKREAFEQAQVIQLFKHPIWHGCRNENRRHDPGEVILKDGLYWVPLIVHYTGARVEEIAGLPAAALLAEGDAWGLDIRPHEERRLKNFQSERLLPIHDHLIELGLIEHRDRMLASKQEYLFPGLRPNNPKYPFHKAMRYNWNEARKMQLGDAAEGLTLHSLRHYVNITLKGNKAIEKSVRLDILGHAAVDLNEEVYSAGTPFAEKLAAINSIPRAF